MTSSPRPHSAGSGPQRPRARGMGLLLPVVLAIVIGIVVRERRPTIHVSQGRIVSLASLEPLRVNSVEVRHYASTPVGDRLVGLLGRQSFTPRRGDRVQVKATLSKPGHAYMILFRPDRGADLCYPSDEQTPPPLTDALHNPLDGEAHVLREGEGLWVFAVIASETPLPPYREWLDQHLAESPWKPTRNPPGETVWLVDGGLAVDTITANGVDRRLRGKGAELVGPPATIQRLTDSLRQAHPAQTATALGFVVAPAR